jgi:probable F420-dependent oxidoreductase
MQPFRFGVNVRSTPSGNEFVALARKIERLGYASLNIPDHLAELFAPMPALAAAAAATTTLRVGTYVLNNDLRHPVVLAREAATVDVLSGGRLDLGIGAGHMKREYDAAGLPFDSGATRVERLAEAVTVIKRLLEGESVTFAGRYYHVTAHTIHPRPVQKPRPPIVIGGNHSRLLTLAAKEADVIALSGITFFDGGVRPDVSAFRASAVDQRVALVRGTAGDRYRDIEMSALVQRVVVTDDRGAAAEELAQHWTSLRAEEILESPYALVGTVDELVADLERRRQRWGIAHYVIPDGYAEIFAPVVARLR